jgi:hypothetical protein
VGRSAAGTAVGVAKAVDRRSSLTHRTAQNEGPGPKGAGPSCSGMSPWVHRRGHGARAIAVFPWGILKRDITVLFLWVKRKRGIPLVEAVQSF